MNRSFRRNLRHREKTARRNEPKARGLDFAPVEPLDLEALGFEIAEPDETAGFSPALIELIPPRLRPDGSIAPAGYRVLAGSPEPHEIESIEKAVAGFNENPEKYVREFPPA